MLLYDLILANTIRDTRKVKNESVWVNVVSKTPLIQSITDDLKRLQVKWNCNRHSWKEHEVCCSSLWLSEYGPGHMTLSAWILHRWNNVFQVPGLLSALRKFGMVCLKFSLPALFDPVSCILVTFSCSRGVTCMLILWWEYSSDYGSLRWDINRNSQPEHPDPSSSNPTSLGRTVSHRLMEALCEVASLIKNKKAKSRNDVLENRAT